MMESRKYSAAYSIICFFFVLFIFGCSSSKDPITYCGEQEEDGPWPECSADRYDVDGPAERLLNKGVSRIIMIDLTVGGPRFAKTLDVVRMTNLAVLNWEAEHSAGSTVEVDENKIGVIYIVHGGFDTYHPQYLWDASVQMFSYDPNHPVYRFFLWNENRWDMILQSGNAEKEVIKYRFEYDRIGGTDPFGSITQQQLENLKQELNEQGAELGLTFEVDWSCWMCGDSVSHYAYPRYLYKTPDGILVDNDTAEPETPLMWVNDYKNLMERSYPTKPEGWTDSLGMPEQDPTVSLSGNPNPVAEDPQLALLQFEAIEKSFSPFVPDNKTAVLLLNHALHDNNEVFDPKINDTLTINKNIKSLLLDYHPEIDPDNIVGAYMGIKEVNPENGKEERTRDMRGENLGYAWLYESDKEMPEDEWGYRYWDALEYLKNRGARHIVVGFPQIITDSVLNLVEIHNQIGKEIGTKTWLYYTELDNETYPGTGHPFADYWGIWVETECEDNACCFEMGGCEDGRPYPPPRQTPINRKRGDEDPSLAYDLSDYGHLGYNPELGPPNPDAPVQDQYTGTWALYEPPNDDPRIGALLAKHIINAAVGDLQ